MRRLDWFLVALAVVAVAVCARVAPEVPGIFAAVVFVLALALILVRGALDRLDDTEELLPEPEPDYVDGMGHRVFNVHDPALCEGRGCAIHHPSGHHMRDWPTNFRDPLREHLTFGLHPGLMERVCPHGVGHPDPDHMDWYASCHSAEETGAERTHGCDGCCVPPQDPVGSTATANEEER